MGWRWGVLSWLRFTMSGTELEHECRNPMTSRGYSHRPGLLQGRKGSMANVRYQSYHVFKSVTAPNVFIALQPPFS